MQNASPYRLCCSLEHTPLQFGDHSGYKFRFKIDCLHFYLHRLQEVEQQYLMYRLVRHLPPPIINYQYSQRVSRLHSLAARFEHVMREQLHGYLLSEP